MLDAVVVAVYLTLTSTQCPLTKPSSNLWGRAGQNRGRSQWDFSDNVDGTLCRWLVAPSKRNQFKLTHYMRVWIARCCNRCGVLELCLRYVYLMVFTAPLSRNQPPADRSPILNPNPTTPLPAKFANIYGSSGVAAVLISGYLWHRLIRPLIRHGPRSLHYSTGR